MRTDAQIDAEIAALRDVQLRVRQFNWFGNYYSGIIDIQIRMLRARMDLQSTYHLSRQERIGDSYNKSLMDDLYRVNHWLFESDMGDAPSAVWAEKTS